MLSTDISMGKCVYMLMVCVLAGSAAAFGSDFSLPPVCQLEFESFLHDLNSQCQSSNPFHSSPIQVDGEALVKAMGSIQKNEYMAILLYASWCPFSRIFKHRFSTLSSMYPQIKHVMVEQSSVMPSFFAIYGIHSVPSLLIVNQTTRIRHHGSKDLQSLASFYKRTTGLDPVVDIAEEMPCSKSVGLYDGGSVTENLLREPYLVVSLVFVVLRGILYLFPKIASDVWALWVACIPHLNLGTFERLRHRLGHALQLIDVRRIWRKLEICKTRNFHEARAWASSSLASVSLGEASSSRGFEN